MQSLKASACFGSAALLEQAVVWRGPWGLFSHSGLFQGSAWGLKGRSQGYGHSINKHCGGILRKQLAEVMGSSGRVLSQRQVREH